MLTTDCFTTSREPTQIDKNTMLLYHSVSDTHLYIDNLEYSTMYTGNAGFPMQPITDVVVNLKEPYGCFFIEKIEKAMKSLSATTWGSVQFFLKADFVGTTPTGDINTIDGVWFHFIPGTNVAVSVNSMAGSEYTIAGVMTDYCYADDEHTIFPHKDAITVKGDKVQTILDDLRNKLNRSYEEAAKMVSGPVKKVRYEFDAGEFGNFDINILNADHIRNAGSEESQKIKGEAKSLGQTLVCQPNTSIASFVHDKVLMNSVQYVQQLSQNRERVNKMDQSGLVTARVIHTAELTDDELILKYSIVKIEGNNFSTIVSQASQAQQPSAHEVLQTKEASPGTFTPDDCYTFGFQYTFGTENLDVESFDMRAENILGFINPDHIGTTDGSTNMSSHIDSRTKTNIVQYNENQYERSAIKKAYDEQTSAASKNIITQPQTYSVQNSSMINNDANMAATKKDAQNTIFKYSSCPGLALQATIRGHLSLLRVDKYLKMKELNDKKNTALLAKFEVRNIDGEKFWNDGYYFVSSITNKFQGGKFKQTLTGFYLGDQETTVQ
jgi:hypothetical protein